MEFCYMSFSIDLFRNFDPILHSLSFDLSYSNQLLVELACSVMQAPKRTYVSFVHIMASHDFWIKAMVEITIDKERFASGSATEAMH